MDIQGKTAHGTERQFGWLFAAVFILACAYFAWRRNPSAAGASFAIAAAFALLATLAPHRLRLLDRAWHWIGQVLGRIVSPIVLGVIYFGLITPVGLVARALGRDELRLRPRTVESYWLPRSPPGPPPDSLNNPY